MQNQVACPHCQAVLKSQKPLRVGRAIRCLRCNGMFVVRQPDPDTLISIPYQPPAHGSVWRIWLTMAGVLMFLVLGAGLIWYCLSLPDNPQQSAQVPAESSWAVSTSAQSNKSSGEAPSDITSATTAQLLAKPEEEPPWAKDAIQRGLAFLRKHVQKNRKRTSPHRLGYAALCGLTLLECGIPPDDPLVLHARDLVLAGSKTLPRTYELALAVLFLDRLGKKGEDDLVRTLALRLVAGQNPDGGWSYNCPVLADAERDKLMEFLRENRLDLRELIRPEEFRTALGAKNDPAEAKKGPSRAVKRTGRRSGDIADLPVANQTRVELQKQPRGRGRSDNSNSQFAMLALWVAQNHGIPLERTFNLVDQRFRATQTKEGSWLYTPGEGHTKPAMTCSGLLGLAVGHGSAQKLALATGAGAAGQTELQDPAIQNGLKYVGQCIGHPLPNPNVYFLWSVERVAVLYHLDTIGGKDWYTWGAKALLASQKENGSWNAAGTYPGANPTIDTCFALLFLRKANFVPGLTRDLREYIRVRDPDLEK